MTEAPVCPRCYGYIPNNDQPGAYPGAMSRRTRGVQDELIIYVCSECGLEEAMIQFAAGPAAILVEQWPVSSDRAVYKREQA